MRFSLRLFIEVVLPAILISGIAYYTYEAVAGATGRRALRSLQFEVADLSADIADLAAERRSLELTASQLNPRSLNPDLVDEKIRSVLGYVESGDVVIPRDQLEALIGPEEERQ